MSDRDTCCPIKLATQGRRDSTLSPRQGSVFLGTSMIALPIASSHLQASQLHGVHDASGPTSELRERRGRCSLCSCTEVWPPGLSPPVGSTILALSPQEVQAEAGPKSQRSTPKSPPCRQTQGTPSLGHQEAVSFPTPGPRGQGQPCLSSPLKGLMV